MSSCRVLFLELDLRVGVSEGCRSQFAFLWCRDEVLLRRSALLVSGLRAQLAVDRTATRRLRAPLLVCFLLLLLLDFFPRFEACEYLVRFPLCPDEIVVFPVVVVAHAPPEAGLQCCSHDARVVAATYVILVWCESRVRELNLLNAVRL